MDRPFAELPFARTDAHLPGGMGALETHGRLRRANERVVEFQGRVPVAGFDLCPRLQDLAQRKLYLPPGFAVPEGIERATVKRLSRKAICTGWDELLRVVASIRIGKIGADVALRLLGTAAQGDPAYKAADHLGRLLRSIFLCDYVAIPDFRREIHMLLSRGESVHQLQRAVYTGKVAPERGRRRDEMKAISGSHALLTNIVLAWNTSRLHEVVEKLKREWPATVILSFGLARRDGHLTAAPHGFRLCSGIRATMSPFLNGP